ncbi:putative RNA-directed DNA polymerase [Helianthus annuus]|nr:putative RNA-directed DNA polymerase [Helianthus annuus]
MYKMKGSDKLYSDHDFPIENVNVGKLRNVFKLIEIDVSEIEGLKQTKRQMNFEKDKAYYKKPVVPPRFYNNNKNKWSGGYQGGKKFQRKNFQNKKFVEKKVFVTSSSSLSDEESKIFSKSNKEFFEKKASQPQSEGTSRVFDTRTCFKCNQVGHIARKCTNLKPKTEAVETQKRKVDVKGKAPLVVEKKVLTNDNTKVKTEPVKNVVTKNDKFYKRVASSQQTWKPKVVETKTSSSKPKISESEKQSSSTTPVKMNVPLDYYVKLEKEMQKSEKKDVPKKDQPSGQPQKDEFFLYKEVTVGSEESLKINDKNFPPLITKRTVLDVQLPESIEAWLPRSVSRWIMDSGAFNGGYAGFARNQGGRIIGEGTLSNGIVTFERVNYIAELENNLLSISQICDRMYTMHFTDKECLILKPGFVVPEEWIIMRAPRVNDLYVLDMSVATTTTGQAHCFMSRATEKESQLWHRKMGHIHLRKMNHLVHNDLVTGVHVKGFHLEWECISCIKGKKKKKSHPGKKENSISRPLERLHMDLFGPVNVKSITGDLYCLVVTDDYSSFSWVSFLKSKDETFESLMALFRKIENLYHARIRRIRSDNGTEFKNVKMEEYCDERGILHEFSAPYTPQQNGVAERKNRTLIEMARTMLADSKLPVNFWADAASAACYTLNRVLTVKKFNKTCFGLINNHKPNLKYLEPFGSPCTVLERFGKFGPKSIEGIFVGYSSPLRRVYVPNLKRIIEAHNVECQGYTMPPQNPGNSWRFHYDTLWNSFDMEKEEEEEVFFDELDILREYESSQERFPAESSRRQRHTSNNDEAGPSNAGEHDDIQQNEVAQDSQTVENDNQESENRTVFDHGDSDSEGEQIQISSQSIPVSEQSVDQNITNLEGEVDVPGEVMPRTLSYHPEELIIGEL